MRPSHLLPALALLVACGGNSNGPGNGTPGVVAQVSATVTNGSITLNWSPVQGAVNYTVYMASQSGVTRANVVTLAGNMTHPGLGTSFDHPAGLDASTVYYFVVTAVNASGESLESCEVTAEIGNAQGGSC